MRVRAMEGTCLAKLVRMAIPICQAAEKQCPRDGPGRPPDYPDWQIAVLIMTAFLKKKKSKSAQYRFLLEHRKEFKRLLQIKGFPARSTYFDRYSRAHGLFEVAIRLQGQRGLDEGVADAQTVAADKSLVRARGPLWHKKDRKAGRVPKGLRGVDHDSSWGYSKHHGWVQGYGFEVVVTTKRGSPVYPLQASADTASVKEFASFESKIDHLAEETKNVLVDSGYDKNALADQVEYDEKGRRTGRRFICPQNPRNSKKGKRSDRKIPQSQQTRRAKRKKFYESQRGQRLYARRHKTVEPFNDWYKTLFELDDRVWHRGLGNNRTQLLASIFGYQLLIRYNYRCGRKNGEIKWILDGL